MLYALLHVNKINNELKYGNPKKPAAEVIGRHREVYDVTLFLRHRHPIYKLFFGVKPPTKRELVKLLCVSLAQHVIAGPSAVNVLIRWSLNCIGLSGLIEFQAIATVLSV